MDDFKERARRLVFNSDLRDFPVIFEMYVMTFGLQLDIDKAMGDIITIIRNSNDAGTAYSKVCVFLDAAETRV